MNNYGILTAISWNSNKWSDKATKEDIENATMGWVMENARMYEDINFGHELYPTEADGSYIGYTPKFNLSNFPTVENTRYVDFVFFTSVDYKTKVNSIVGFYAYPEIGRFEHNTDHPYYKDYTWGNIKAKPQHIVLFDNPLPINDEIALKNKMLPTGNKLSSSGYNYLTYGNVLKLLDYATKLNPEQSKLRTIKLRFLKETQHLSIL